MLALVAVKLQRAACARAGAQRPHQIPKGAGRARGRMAPAAGAHPSARAASDSNNSAHRPAAGAGDLTRYISDIPGPAMGLLMTATLCKQSVPFKFFLKIFFENF